MSIEISVCKREIERESYRRNKMERKKKIENKEDRERKRK